MLPVGASIREHPTVVLVMDADRVLSLLSAGNRRGG